MKTHSFTLLLAAALLVSPSAPAAEPEIQEVHLDAAAADKALEGKLKYNFAIVSADELIDQDGRHFSPDDVAAYLARTKPDQKAAYVFWVADESAVAVVKRAIPGFGAYGATVFVIRKTNEPDRPQAKAADETKAPKTLLLVGRANPASHSAKDPTPDMSGRPAFLRPGELPRRVRYLFKPDAVVVAAADSATKLFLGPTPGEITSVVKNDLWVQPGAWRWLKNAPSLAGSKPLISTVELRREVLKLEGRFTDKPEQVAAAIAGVRRLIAADGGGKVRALTSAEMQAWWTFISLDIEEPTFVIETAGGRYRFIVAYTDNHLSLVDELNALPAQ